MIHVDDIIIVTGAAQGMGYAAAKRLLAEDTAVCLVDKNENVLQVSNELNSSLTQAFGYVCDLSDTDQVQALIEQVGERFGKITKLVNAAGISASGSFLDTKNNDYLQTIMAVNFGGVWNMCRAVIPWMLKAGGGSIVNFSSVTGNVVTDAGMSAYSASKGAVSALTRALAMEFAEHNINVNAVLPGYIWTGMLAKYNLADPDSVKRRLSKGIPMGRLGEADEVAQIVSFLLSSGAKYITGQGIVVDGGSSLVETKELIKKGDKKVD